MKAQKKILVTGGAGLIGKKLCQTLLDSGHFVTCLDNFFTSSKADISKLARQENFSLIEADITNADSLTALYVDEIYNLACPASPVHYQHDPVKTLMTSVVGVDNLLKLALKNNATILQASTSEVYGDPDISPQPESYPGRVNTIGPRACYDEGKRAAETLMHDYQQTQNADIRIARIFNTYGPGMHPYDGRVVSNFILQALANEEITIYGSGEQTRSFCFIDDLVAGLIALMQTTGAHAPVNLGNPHEVTVLELAEHIIKLTGSKSKLVFMPLPKHDPLQRRPDITRARDLLNWQPATKLSQGLTETIEYFKNLDLSKFTPPTNNKIK